MSYQSEELIREVQGQRVKAALSQRALAARSGIDLGQGIATIYEKV